MKRLAALPLLLLVALGASGVFATAPASARCAVSLDVYLYSKDDCSASGKVNLFMKVKTLGAQDLGGGLQCAEVEDPNTETGAYTEDFCANKVGQRRWVKVTKPNGFEWMVAGSAMVDKGLSSETVNIAQKSSTEFTLEGKVIGIAIVIKAKKLSSESGKIIPGGGGSGVLSFSELTVTKPAGCAATSPLKSKSLKTELAESSGTLYDKFVPAEGETLANVVITGCVIAGTYSVNGSVYAQTEPIYTELSSQPLTFSKAINEAAGGSMTIAKEPATLTGEATFSLSGTYSGQKFGGI